MSRVKIVDKFRKVLHRPFHLFFFSIVFFILSCHLECAVHAEELSSVSFSQRKYADLSSAKSNVKKRTAEVNISRRSQRGISDAAHDEKCHIEDIDAKLKAHTHSYTFEDENENLALYWTGDRGRSLLAVTTEEFAIFAEPSKLWISHDFGVTFENINEKVNHAVIRKDNGVFRNHVDSAKLILVSYPHQTDPSATVLFVTQDGGKSFDSVPVDFLPEGQLKFHSSKSDWVLAHSPTKQYKLWFSKDSGLSWKSVRDDVVQYEWGSRDIGTEDVIFASVGEMSYDVPNVYEAPKYTLFRSNDGGDSWIKLKENIYSFSLQSKFLFVAVDVEGKQENEDRRVLHVSANGGHTWNVTQLPEITDDMFFSILDMSEGMIIIHVDDIGNTGSGTIYTSDADGIVFSTSLENHLFPNGGAVTDFYRVDSMRGVYLASQMDDEQYIHTMVSFDRCGEWKHVKAPKGMKCADHVKAEDCNLQIHNQYSRVMHIHVPSGPLSIQAATGLILAHGNVADGLETDLPDVFVSSDGGYNWTKALDGPHQYIITNFGGLIVAIPDSEGETDTVRFSYDEGHCWNDFKFSEEKLIITGLLPEPASKSLNVSIWGFSQSDRRWRTFTINFEAVLETDCTESDFMEWKPHSDNGKSGCLLGMKETFQKVKPDSFCRVQYEFGDRSQVSSSPCKCSKEDYECDFGFQRQDDQSDCVINPDFSRSQLLICELNKEFLIESWGYRKIPGDRCEGNPSWAKRSYQDLHKHCPAWEQETLSVVEKKHRNAVTWIGIILLVIVACVGFYILKERGLCQEKSTKMSTKHSHWTGTHAALRMHCCAICSAIGAASRNGTAIQYSKLRDDEDAPLDITPKETYHDDSDEDILA